MTLSLARGDSDDFILVLTLIEDSLQITFEEVDRVSARENNLSLLSLRLLTLQLTFSHNLAVSTFSFLDNSVKIGNVHEHGY